MVSVDIEDETASLELLLNYGFELGFFSITSAWMEHYKRASQKDRKD